MASFELPQTISSTFFPSGFITLAVSRARRPYSCATLWPICQGPSISFPRHHKRTSYGSATPWLLRRSLQAVPPGWLQYSAKARAAFRSPDPRFTASIISMSAFFAHFANSLMPTWLVSFERQARSSRTGRLSFGPMPSSQL